METEQTWGIGNAKDAEAFDTTKVGDATLELIHGEHPHSRQDNSTYARRKDGSIVEFDGHRRAFKIEIEERNYLKSSEMSGDEIRKGGGVKVFCDGVQVLDEFTRSYENGYRIAHNFITDMEIHWGWYPRDANQEIGKVVRYNNQLFKINSFIISQTCLILGTLDGKPRKKFLWEHDDDFTEESEIKVELLDHDLDLYPDVE